MIVKLIFSLVILAPLINSPLNMGIVLIFYALIVSVYILLSLSSWISIVFFIIYIGGLIVIFSYFMSIIPNQPLPSPLTLTIFRNVLFFILFDYFYQRKTIPDPLTEFTAFIYQPYIQILATLLYVLFFILISVVAITKPMGRLRPFAPPRFWVYCL